MAFGILVSSFFLRDLVDGRFFQGNHPDCLFPRVFVALRTLPSLGNAEQIVIADTTLLSWGSPVGRIFLTKRPLSAKCLVVLLVTILEENHRGIMYKYVSSLFLITAKISYVTPTKRNPMKKFLTGIITISY